MPVETAGACGPDARTPAATSAANTSPALMASIVGARPRTMSYPYGRPVPGAEGFAAAFTTERKVNETFEEPLLLGRFDTNDLPGGRRAD